MKVRFADVCAMLFSICVLTAVAGTPAPASGVRIETVPNTVAAPVNGAGGTGAVLNGQDAASGGTNQSTNSSAAASASSANGNTSSAFGLDPRATKDSNAVATEIGREKVIDTGDKAVETDKRAKAEPSDKTFTPHLLDTVTDISGVSSQKDHGAASNNEDSQSKRKSAVTDKDSGKKN